MVNIYLEEVVAEVFAESPRFSNLRGGLCASANNYIAKKIPHFKFSKIKESIRILYAVAHGGFVPVSYTHLTLPTNREV